MSLHVHTRFAPSPTGSLHLGNARTALFSHLWARKSAGRFVLRIEDTDIERSQPRYREELFEDLRWLGIDWDEGPGVGGPGAPYLQSERGGFYAELFDRLEYEGHAYPCYCTPEELELSRKLQRMSGQPPRYAGTCRELGSAQRAQKAGQGLRPTLRFRVPPGVTIEFVDLVHGPQRFVAADIGDFIVRREDGTAAFYFCNAVDDAAMGITHVLRGDDHLTNTPRQLMLLDALGLRRPLYGHVGLLVGADGSPLSKRHGSTSVREFRERGFRPEALLNHLFHLGHASDVEDFLPLGQMPAHFRPDHLGRAPARFDEAQLIHWQKVSIARATADSLTGWLAAAVTLPRDAADASAFAELVRHNVVLPADATAWAAAAFGDLPPLDDAARQVVREAGPAFFSAALRAYEEAGGDWKGMTMAVRKATGRSGAALFLPLRVALTGQQHGPELAPLLKLMSPSLARSRLQLHAQNP
ncbi:MAG: glutamate--tRNA ligase [Steroidobacteraceae bacterium]